MHVHEGVSPARKVHNRQRTSETPRHFLPVSVSSSRATLSMSANQSDGTWTLVGKPSTMTLGGKTRLVYDQVQAIDKRIYTRGENVTLLSDIPSKPYVAHINFFYFDSDNEQVMMSNNWFYRSEEVTKKQKQKFLKHELLWSSMQDNNSCAR